MKIDVYEVFRDLDYGEWERTKKGTVEIPLLEENHIHAEGTSYQAAKMLDLDPNYTRCFPAGEKVKLHGKFSRDDLKYWRRIEEEREEEGMSEEELEAKYE